MKNVLKATVVGKVTRRIVKAFRPARIIMFGSRAYGRPNADSDLDLLVVVRREPAREREFQVADGLRKICPVPVQLVFMSRRRFEDTRDVVGGLAYPAHHQGKVLFEAEA